MSSSSAGFKEEVERRGAQVPLGLGYIPTEEERKLLKECRQESLYYRELPFAVVSMAITQAFVSRGFLSASPRFGALPKVAFAGFCGYMAGRISYMKTCQEKFKKLENSPLADALRGQRGLLPQSPNSPQSELSDPNSQNFDTMFQPAEGKTQTSEPEHGFNPETPSQMRNADFNAPVQTYMEEDVPKRKAILYEDLRIKNRENYEVTLTQKAETLLKTPPEKEQERPTKSVKKNIYGDTWEE
ncbi:OCIA domain-containing protein 1-like [Dunckerocampus dactyliophorus]|uniref:OCIA domain-containing protein 1-like n=1 Tax=Dunckerocampus dactyliophorus TaxID=161453 RepID=UPI00240551EB|nr:OCIA domain-containing protein 1-like [Dunckerocampus dactyliophorus]